MRYIVYFASGNTIIISEEDYKVIVKEIENHGITNYRHFVVAEFGKIIDIEKIEFIKAATPDIPNAQSGVIIRPSPQDIRNEERKKLEEIRSDPKKIISRIKMKNE
jgi:hypothetical protein